MTQPATSSGGRSADIQAGRDLLPRRRCRIPTDGVNRRRLNHSIQSDTSVVTLGMCCKWNTASPSDVLMRRRRRRYSDSSQQSAAVATLEVCQRKTPVNVWLERKKVKKNWRAICL